MSTLFINGKFAAQRVTGVQRVARNLLDALDTRLAAGQSFFDGHPVLMLPAGATAPALRHIETRRLGGQAVPLHLWEQCLLPVAARSGLLLNLSGSAPLLAGRQVCMIHDAAVFDRPQAYSAAFRAWYRALFWSLSRRRTRLLTVSAYSQQRLATQLGVPASRVGVVPSGAEHLLDAAPDFSVLAMHQLEPYRYFLAVGSANPNKNFDALQMAFARLPQGQGIKLVIVGDAYPGVFAGGTLADVAGVVHTGRLDDARLKALYVRAAGLVFPSLYEGFGLPPLEAMSCGCPVAASNVAAIPEVCGDAALYFDPSSVDHIANAMQRLLGDAPLRERLRRVGAERVLRFRWDLAAAALQSHLQSAWAEGFAA